MKEVHARRSNGLGRILAATLTAMLVVGCAADVGDDDAPAETASESSALLAGYSWIRSVGSIPDWACLFYDGNGGPRLVKYCDNKAAFAWKGVGAQLQAQSGNGPPRCLSVTTGGVGGVAFVDSCSTGAKKQQWVRELAGQVPGHTFVRLVNKKQGKCLRRPSSYERAPQLAECNAGDRAQLWEIMPAIIQPDPPPAPLDCFATYCYAIPTGTWPKSTFQVHGTCDAEKLRAAADAIAAERGYTEFVQEGFCP